MEEQAELALLESHLAQTSRLSTRMTAILATLDTRLSLLDKTISPFQIAPLQAEASNIDKALRILDGERVAENITKGGNDGREFAVGKQEEEVLSRVPDFGGLEGYVQAMSRVLEEVSRLEKNSLRSNEAVVKELCKLIDLASRNVISLALKHAREGSSQSLPIDRILASGPLDPPILLSTYPIVLRVLASLRGLLTSASPAAARFINSAIQSGADGFAAIRRETITTKGVNPLVRDFDHICEGPTSPGGEEEGRKEKSRAMVKMLDALAILLEGEAILISELFPDAADPATAINSIFSQAILTVSDVLNTQVNVIKKSLSTHTFYAFELYSTLLGAQPGWEDAMRKFSGDPRNESVVGEVTSALRGVCLRSFPEVLVDVKTGGTGQSVPQPGVGVAEMTYKIVAYLETFPAYENLVNSLLSQVGEGNWRMGAAAAAPTGVSSRSSDEDGLLQSYVRDLLAALVDQLKQRSRSMQPPVSGTFLLNNISYMRNNLILSPTSSSSAADVLGVGAEDLLNSAFREAKSIYMVAWQELAAFVSDEKTPQPTSRFKDVVGVGGGGEKTMVKENLHQFYERLDSLENTSRQHQISRKDPNLRERLATEVRELVVGQYTAFIHKHNRVVEKCEPSRDPSPPKLFAHTSLDIVRFT